MRWRVRWYEGYGKDLSNQNTESQNSGYSLLKLPADAYLILVIAKPRLTHRTLAGKLGLVLVYYSFDVDYV